MVRVLMRPRSWLRAESEGFLRSAGIGGRRTFAVLAVRRGNKSSEVEPVAIEEFTNQLHLVRAMYSVSDILVQTESEQVLVELRLWCDSHGFRLHYTSNRRIDVDSFSPTFARSGGVNMTEEGRVAAVNLLVGSGGVAIFGSLHSAWLKIMPAFMVAHQWKAVLVVGLAGQENWALGSYTGAEAEAQQLLKRGEVFRLPVALR